MLLVSERTSRLPACLNSFHVHRWCCHGKSFCLYRLVRETVTVTQRYYYSAYPALGCYSQFPLLDISRYWLLHNVSYTRRIQWKALLAFLLKHSITRHFNYSTFQRSHRITHKAFTTEGWPGWVDLGVWLQTEMVTDGLPMIWQVTPCSSKIDFREEL